MKKQSKKNIAAAIAGLVVVGGAGMIAGAQFFPHTVMVDKPFPVEKPVPNPVNLELQKQLDEANNKISDLESAPVQTETQTVFVDNGKLADVLQAVFDSHGNVEYATDGLDEKDVSLLADRIIQYNDFKAMAENEVRSEAFRELHKDNSTGVLLLKDDMRSLSIDYDTENIDFADFDHGDADVAMTVFFKQGTDKFSADLVVRFLDGKFDQIDVDSVTKL